MCVTEAIREATLGRLTLEVENLGEQRLKGFEQPVHVHAVRLRPGSQVPSPEPRQASMRQAIPRVAAAVVVTTAVAAGIAVAWLKPWQPDTEPASVDLMAHALPSKPSVAVLPFKNLSGDPEQDFLADGFTQEIITALSRTPDLFVIASSSTETYKDRVAPAKQVADGRCQESCRFF